MERGRGDNFELNLMLICFKIVEQLEYGLDNANPGYGFNGEELIGNEDDSESWYNSSTTDSRIHCQWHGNYTLCTGAESFPKVCSFYLKMFLKSQKDTRNVKEHFTELCDVSVEKAIRV